MPAEVSSPAPDVPTWYRHPVLWLVLATLVCLGPFVRKAVHVDDYLFIRSARQILEHPSDPFGSVINWYDTAMPLASVTQNPPGVSYYLAGVGGLFGRSELALHLAFLLPALAAVLGTYVVARRFCPQPAVAAGLALVSPVFWVSATTLMSDVPMLALWLWAVDCWLRGLERGATRWFAVSAILIALAVLTKYFGAALLPLLLAYTLIRERRPSWELLWLLLPVAVLLAYEWATTLRYGHGMLGAAGHYTQIVARPGTAWQRVLIALSFTGGCLLPVLMFAPYLWSRRGLAVGGLVGVALVGALPLAEKLGVTPLHFETTTRWGLIVQVALFAVGGLSVLVLTLDDLRTNHDADAWLLALWVGGTLFFAVMLNWTVAGRSLLPLAPVVGILVVRRMARRIPRPGSVAAGLRWWPLLPAALVGAAVAQADATLAGDARTAARVIHEQLGGRGAGIWFQGHWGFQYYMEAAGATPVDKGAVVAAPGDYLVTPEINSNSTPPPEAMFERVGDIEIASGGWIVVMHIPSGAGFYSDQWGPLPFVVAPVPTQRFTISRARPW